VSWPASFDAAYGGAQDDVRAIQVTSLKTGKKQPNFNWVTRIRG